MELRGTPTISHAGLIVAPPRTIDDYASRIRSGRRFGVARYGDGEWGAVLGKIQQTIYGDKVTPELADAIRHTLLEPKPYFYASLGEPWSREVNAWIDEHSVKCRWAKKQVLENASAEGNLLPFLQALREKDVLLVGLPHLRKMDELIGCTHFSMPGVNCYGRKVYPTVLNSFEVVLFACGLASVTLIHELWDQTDATLIDIGSLFDPYCGVESRRGHKREKFRVNVRKTLEALVNDIHSSRSEGVHDGVPVGMAVHGEHSTGMDDGDHDYGGDGGDSGMQLDGERETG